LRVARDLVARVAIDRAAMLALEEQPDEMYLALTGRQLATVSLSFGGDNVAT